MKSGEYNVDSLFREKLEGFEPELSSDAVDRMNRIITRKSNNMIFRRISIAAGISLNLAGTVLLIRFRYFQPTENIASNADQVTVQTRVSDDTGKNIPGVQPSETSLNDHQENKSDVTGNNKKAIPPTINKFTTRNESVIISNTEREELPARDVLVVEPIDKKTLAAGNPVVPSDLTGATTGGSGLIKENGNPGPIVIEYISGPDSRVHEQGRSGAFAEIIEKANEIRNEVTLGNLREAKDQLFALEFIKSRNSNNNPK